MVLVLKLFKREFSEVLVDYFQFKKFYAMYAEDRDSKMIQNFIFSLNCTLHKTLIASSYMCLLIMNSLF
jgi:hypothetical protein